MGILIFVSNDLKHCNLHEDHTLVSFADSVISTKARSPRCNGLVLQVTATITCFLHNGGMILKMVLDDTSRLLAMPPTQHASGSKCLDKGGLGQDGVSRRVLG